MEAIGEHIKRHNNSEEKTSIFAEYLYGLINQYGFTNAADLYNKANVFGMISKIKSMIFTKRTNCSKMTVAPIPLSFDFGISLS